jgi:hypothetical protein
VITPNLFGFQAAQNTFGTGRPYVNGAREQANNFILDGMDNNQADNNDVGYVPAPEAVQEFNLLTSNASADFGNYLGGVVNVTLKSGTNQFHGDLYTYIRRGGWNANSWTNNLNAIPRPGLHYDNFGATFGGPIVKSKLFFFLDFAGSRWSQPSTTTQLNTLSLAERAGNFAEICQTGFTAGICNPAPAGSTLSAIQLFDPASSANPATRTPFLNNQIPLGRFSSSAKAILSSQFYPSTQLANNVSRFTTNSYQGDGKIDFIPSDRDHVMTRWSQQSVEAPTTNSILLLGNADKTFPLKNFVVDYTHTFTPNLLNDARIGFSYFPVTEGFSNPTGLNLPVTFGIAGVTSTFLPALLFTGPGLQPGTIGNNELVQSFHDTTLQFEDTFTLTRGRHVIHAGFQVLRYIQNVLYPGNAGLAGQFTFNGQFSGNFGAPNASVGFSSADFVLGLPQDVQQGNGGGGNRYLRNTLVAGFGQDNVRVNHALTLNLGLRYELVTPRYEVNNRTVNFDLITGQPLIGGVNGVSRSTYNPYTGITNFQPRIGIAWTPDFLPNTVFRGAYAITGFMEANGVNNLPYQNPPFVEAHQVTFAQTQALPNSTLDQGFSNFPAGCTLAALQALSPLCIQGSTLHLTNPNLRPAVNQEWNFSIQHQFGSHTSIQAGYVGNKVDHMSNIFIFNQKQLNNGVVTPGPFAQPLINCCGTGNSPTIRFNDTSAIQRYNALQVTLEQRAFRGLDFRVNYTWSKCMSDSLGYFGPFGDEEALPGTVSQTGFSFFYQDAYNPKHDYGLCISDAAQLFNGYLVYEMPFGRGKMFGGNAGDFLNAIIGGWTVATNFTLHTGFAITPAGPDNSGALSFSPRANCVLGVSKDGSGAIVSAGGTPPLLGKQWWNPASVIPAFPNTFGNCAIGSFRGPGLTTADLNVAKRFPVTERVSVEFLAQLINVTNTPFLGRPNFSQGATFGIITSSNPGRQIQVGGKLHF